MILTYQLHDLDGNHHLSRKRVELIDNTGVTPIDLLPIEVAPTYNLCGLESTTTSSSDNIDSDSEYEF